VWFFRSFVKGLASEKACLQSDVDGGSSDGPIVNSRWFCIQNISDGGTQFVVALYRFVFRFNIMRGCIHLCGSNHKIRSGGEDIYKTGNQVNKMEA